MKNKIINSTIVETPKLGVSTNIGTNINNIAKKRATTRDCPYGEYQNKTCRGAPCGYPKYEQTKPVGNKNFCSLRTFVNNERLKNIKTKTKNEHQPPK